MSLAPTLSRRSMMLATSSRDTVLDTAFHERSVESAIIDVLVPFFVRVGEQWELGRIGIAQEHFASSLVRRRLGALSLTWGCLLYTSPSPRDS